MLGGGTKPSAVSLAGVPVGDVTTFSDTEIKVVAASSAKKTGDIIIVSDSGSVVTLTNGFSYLATAAVSKLVPSAGQRGTKVEIQGVGLLQGGSKVTSVKFARSRRASLAGAATIASR